MDQKLSEERAVAFNKDNGGGDNLATGNTNVPLGPPKVNERLKWCDRWMISNIQTGDFEWFLDKNHDIIALRLGEGGHVKIKIQSGGNLHHPPLYFDENHAGPEVELDFNLPGFYGCKELADKFQLPPIHIPGPNDVPRSEQNPVDGIQRQ